VPDELLGKTVRCPSCKATFDAHAEEAGIAMIDEDAPPPPPRPSAVADEHEDDYGERPVRRRVRRSEVASSLTMAPGIAVLTVGILALLNGLFGGILFFALMGARGPGGQANFPGLGPGFPAGGPANPMQFMFQGLGSLIVGLCWGGLVIAGGISIIRRKIYPLAMTGSIVGMVPCNCCCVLGLPIGIWALVVLAKPEVKDAFT
jgi:hypothetical protein